MLQKSDRFVCDRKLQCFRLGELHHALDVGIISQDADITDSPMSVRKPEPSFIVNTNSPSTQQN